MLPVTPRTSSRPASIALGAGRGGFRLRLLLLALGVGLADDDLLQGHARPLLPLALDLGRRPAVELPAALGRQHDEQVTVGDPLQALLQRGERHRLSLLWGHRPEDPGWSAAVARCGSARLR